jgi:hypothetical protein
MRKEKRRKRHRRGESENRTKETIELNESFQKIVNKIMRNMNLEVS